MRRTILPILSAFAVALLGGSAFAQTSDMLTITSTTANARFSGTHTFSETDETAANVTAQLDLFTSVQSFLNVTTPLDQPKLNASAGLTVLVEPGVSFDASVANTLTAADLFNAQALARAGLSLNNISDIIGITSDVAVINTTPGTISTTTITFGVLNDIEAGLLGSSLGGVTFPLHFFTEGDAGQNQFITAALNVDNPPNPTYTATFTSDVDTSTVPDTGTTISLFGLGLAGLAFVSRKIA
jgi:hypothetical protein